MLHLKPEDGHPKISEYCRNEAKTTRIFYGLWVASHPISVSPSELMLQENSPLISVSHPKESMKEEAERGREKEKDRREDRTL